MHCPGGWGSHPARGQSRSATAVATELCWSWSSGRTSDWGRAQRRGEHLPHISPPSQPHPPSSKLPKHRHHHLPCLTVRRRSPAFSPLPPDHLRAGRAPPCRSASPAALDSKPQTTTGVETLQHGWRRRLEGLEAISCFPMLLNLMRERLAGGRTDLSVAAGNVTIREKTPPLQPFLQLRHTNLSLPSSADFDEIQSQSSGHWHLPFKPHFPELRSRAPAQTATHTLATPGAALPSGARAVRLAGQKLPPTLPGLLTVFLFFFVRLGKLRTFLT